MAEPTPGAGEAPPPENNPQASPAPVPRATPEPALPAAAQVVLNGTKTEREIELERSLQTEREARKKVEQDNAQLTDELHRLTVPTPGPQPQPARRGPLGVRTTEE